MSNWHVWGDYCHTRPARIGDAVLTREEGRARKTADANGFDFDRRLRNGFEPWAAQFESKDDARIEFEFASCPTVRGWKRVG